MKTKQVEDKWENARSQAQAQFESIREMVEALLLPHRRLRCREPALSVEVRSDWSTITDYPAGPAEYRILLCTGGPAVQITGNLSEHGEPETARLEMQDWFLPWTEYRPHAGIGDERGRPVPDTKAEEILLVYARQFYFGVDEVT